MAHGFTDNKETADLDAYINSAIGGLKAQVTALQNTINSYWQKIYPIGSIYTTVSTTNPAALFGGTWERYGVGRTLVGVDATQSEFNGVNKTGGAKSNNYTPRGSVSGSVGGHALTVNEMPSHNHDGKGWQYNGYWIGNTSVGGGDKAQALVCSGVGEVPPDTGTNRIRSVNAGGGAAHNHGFNGSFSGVAQAVSTLQPYTTVYFWRRTA